MKIEDCFAASHSYHDSISAILNFATLESASECVFRCDDGYCQSSSRECLPTPACPLNIPRRCPNGTCIEMHLECAYAYQPCNTAQKLCVSGICSHSCPDYDGCSADLPIRCPTGICSSRPDACRGSCNQGQLECVDGSCVDDANDCPASPRLMKPLKVSIQLKDIDESGMSIFSDDGFPLGSLNLLDFYPSVYMNSMDRLRISPVSDKLLASLRTQEGPALLRESSGLSHIYSTAVNLEIACDKANILLHADKPTKNSTRLCLARLIRGVWICESSSNIVDLDSHRGLSNWHDHRQLDTAKEYISLQASVSGLNKGIILAVVGIVEPIPDVVPASFAFYSSLLTYFVAIGLLLSITCTCCFGSFLSYLLYHIRISSLDLESILVLSDPSLGEVSVSRRNLTRSFTALESLLSSSMSMTQSFNSNKNVGSSTSNTRSEFSIKTPSKRSRSARRSVSKIVSRAHIRYMAAESSAVDSPPSRSSPPSSRAKARSRGGPSPSNMPIMGSLE